MTFYKVATWSSRVVVVAVPFIGCAPKPREEFVISFSNNSSGFAFTVRLNVIVKGGDMIYKLYIVPIRTRKLSPIAI